MSETWVVRLQEHDAASLGRLRQTSGLEVLPADKWLWLRVAEPDPATEAQIRALPGICFRVLPDGQLVLFGAHVPKGHVPQGHWVRLCDWLRLRVEPAAWSAEVTDRVRLQLVRGGTPGEVNVLETGCDDWRDYGTCVPQVRLQRWVFAMSALGQVVIRGTPLPALPGTRFVESAGVAVPAGYQWTPTVGSDVIRAALGLEGDDLALVHMDGSWDQIRSHDFVRATRSAVRVSTEASEHD